MVSKQELIEALTKGDVDSVVALTGVSYEKAQESCEKAVNIYEYMMAKIRLSQDTDAQVEQLSELAESLLSRQK